jgi:hypothetical protein
MGMGLMYPEVRSFPDIAMTDFLMQMRLILFLTNNLTKMTDTESIHGLSDDGYNTETNQT